MKHSIRLAILCVNFLLPFLLHAGNNYSFPDDSGAFDNQRLRVGLWKEYKVDSSHESSPTKADIKRWIRYDTAKIVIIMNVGNYTNGHRQGTWKTYICYSAAKPYNWNLSEIAGITGGFLNGTWKYFSYDGKVISDRQYSMGKKNGVGHDYYLSGKIKSERHFKDGHLEGKEKIYFESGQLIRVQSYLNGYLNGQSKQYYENGKTRFVRVYKNGIVWAETKHFDYFGKPLARGDMDQGIGTINYYTDGGGLNSTYTYKYGRKQGKCLIYYKSGKLWRELYFSGDSLNGPEKTYSENGNLISEGIIKKGKYNGAYTFYYDNGKKWGEYIYKDGLIWNVTFLNDTNGKPLDAGTLKNGNGILKAYDDSSRLAWSYEYSKGVRNGEHFTYYTNGKVHYNNIYVNDTLSGADSIYNEHGFLKRSGMTKKGEWDGIITSYYYNGKIKCEESYRAGLYWEILNVYDTTGKKVDGGTLKNGIGTFKLYSDSGKTWSITEYEFGVRNGKSTAYYENGAVKNVLLYTNDTLDGLQQYYYPDGKMEMKTTIDMGKKNGSAFVYHKNGTLWTERIYYNGYLMNVPTNLDASGKKMDPGTIKNGNGNFNQFDEDGKLLFVHTVVNGYVADFDKLDE